MKKLRTVIQYLFALTRWPVWYRSKVSLFFTCMFYAALTRKQLEPLSAMLEMAGLLFILSLLAAFGHMVNSLSDVEVDRAAGKPCPFTSMSKWSANLLVAAPAVIGLLATVLFYPTRWDVIILFFAAFVIATIYSLPPIRLKERGSLGLFTAAVAQRTVPAIIIFQAMQCWDWVAFDLCVLGTLTGLRAILWHQMMDVTTDAASAVQTFVVNKGESLSRQLLGKIVYPLEALTLLATVTLMAWKFPLFAVAPVLYGIWFLYRALFGGDPYQQFITDSSDIFKEFYEIVWPLLLAALLIRRDPLFWILFGFTLLWLYCYELARMLRMLVASNSLITSHEISGE